MPSGREVGSGMTEEQRIRYQIVSALVANGPIGLDPPDFVALVHKLYKIFEEHLVNKEKQSQ